MINSCGHGIWHAVTIVVDNLSACTRITSNFVTICDLYFVTRGMYIATQFL